MAPFWQALTFKLRQTPSDGDIESAKQTLKPRHSSTFLPRTASQVVFPTINTFTRDKYQHYVQNF
jgi:hypothetical protein